ncbi:ricin-type beta-trefoil lectin domain protein [Streptomyces coerulescens]|uniref:Ricin-type beta-trefoil lectin domain protein n=1 Tax=Streptomyces coerulescens TaxID=29304 RepID=A0ABW0CUC1_STRCD
MQDVSARRWVCGDGTGPGFGPCSVGHSHAWTVRSVGPGAFQLVNCASGFCMTASDNDYPAFLSSCGVGSDRWRFEAATAAGQSRQNTAVGGCLAVSLQAFMGELVFVAACDSDEPEQLWRDTS